MTRVPCIDSRRARRAFNRAQRLRRDVGAIRPTDGPAGDKEPFELRLLRKRPEYFSMEPPRKVDDPFRAVRKTKPQLVVTNVLRFNDAYDLFRHFYSSGAMLSSCFNRFERF